ncbi:choice-of-anchor A family protein [Gimibacter soli]|uniref:Choice-of-anchor A family protein n=1 Tax=Gimibacter soli TaxID=3024400 RepID=A0AAF0BL99_9PROT|nr:choice-of-anchor A family protein [Gimibacter soli]WCL52921.1 choice-of-anchor A family protein [Gimibacter soli]
MFKSVAKFAAAPLLAAALMSAPGQASTSFDLFGSYNAIFFGDYSLPNSDVEGALAVGGNASLSSFSVGDKLSNPDYALVVGGNLTTGSGRIYYGDVAVGGEANLDSSVYWGLKNEGQEVTSDLPIDFAAVEQLAKDTAAHYAGMGATGTVDNAWGTYTIGNTADGGPQVFNMTADQLKEAHTLALAFTPSNGSSIIINVSGSIIDMTNMGFFQTASQNILFNFYEAETVNIGSVGIYGNILAPTADFVTQYGQINGVVIGGSWTGSVQVNNSLGFNDDSWVPNEPSFPTIPGVPEPATWLMMIFGFGFVGLAARRRKGVRALTA